MFFKTNLHLNIAFIAAVVAISFVGAATYFFLKTLAVSEIAKMNENYVGNVVTSVADNVRRNEESLYDIAISATPLSGEELKNGDYSAKWLVHKFTVLPDVLGITLADHHSNFIRIPVFSESERLEYLKPKNRPWYAHFKKESDYRKIYFTEPYFDEVTEKTVISLTLPLSGDDMVYLGSVAIDLDLAFIDRAVQNFTPPVVGQFYIFTEKGGVVYNNKDSEQVFNLYSERGRGVRGFFYDKETHACYYYSSLQNKNPSWFFIYRVEYDDLSSVYNKYQQTFVIGSVVAVFIIFCLWLYVYLMLERVYASVAAGIRNKKAYDGNASLLKDEIENNAKNVTELQNELLIDGLTGLYNRKSLDAAINSEESYTCIAMIDLDNFKSINDNYGHAVGDMVLRTVATSVKRIQNNLIECYRYGGEEIVLLFKDHQLNEAFTIVDELRKNLSDKEWRESGLCVTFSSGLCCVEEHASLGAAMEYADELLYVAKKTGKNKVVITLEQ